MGTKQQMADASLADLPAQVALALSLASSSTGTDYHYLLNTARSESSFQAEAKAPTSSAQGLFQFIEETWIRTIKDEGDRYGLGDYAAKIIKTPQGRYLVPDPKDRAAILALRRDPKISAMMAGAYAKRNAEFVEAGIGRRPTSEELYMAHFLGPSDAVRLIAYRDSKSWASAPDLFPAAAKANRPIFFGDGGPRTVGQVYDLLVARQHNSGVAASDNGAFFSGNIDFGSWKPTVEMIYAPSKRAAPKPQLASMDGGISLFEMLAGKGQQAAPIAIPVADDGKGWDAQVDTGQDSSGQDSTGKAAPYITVEDDGSKTMLGGLLSTRPSETTDTPADATFADSVPAQAAAPAVPVAASAIAEPDPSRLKIIHVPKKE